MPAGHLNPDINKRKKLTPGMEHWLVRLSRQDKGPVDWRVQDTASKNQLRALMDRGLAEPVGNTWHLTEAGEAHLAQNT